MSTLAFLVILSLHHNAWAENMQSSSLDLSITQVWKGDDLVSENIYGVIIERQKIEPTFLAGENFYHMLITLASLQLADAGRLRMDDAVSEQLPQQSLAALSINKNWCSYVQDDKAGACYRLTPRHLLSSSAGLIDTRTCDYPAGAWQIKYCENDISPERDLDVERAVSAIWQRPLSEAPGAFRKADENFMLLGYLLEQITGEPLNEYLQKSMLAPLGLSQSKLISSTDAAARKTRCVQQKKGQSHVFGTVQFTIGDLAKLYASVFVAKNVSQVSVSSLQDIAIGGVHISCRSQFRDSGGNCASGFAVDSVLSAEGTPLMIGNIEFSSCGASSIVVINGRSAGDEPMIIAKVSSRPFDENFGSSTAQRHLLFVSNITTSGQESRNYLGPGEAIAWVMIPVLAVTAVALAVLEIYLKNRMESLPLPSVSKLTLETADSKSVLNPLSDNIGNDDL